MPAVILVRYTQARLRLVRITNPNNQLPEGQIFDEVEPQPDHPARANSNEVSKIISRHDVPETSNCIFSSIYCFRCGAVFEVAVTTDVATRRPFSQGESDSSRLGRRPLLGQNAKRERNNIGDGFGRATEQGGAISALRKPESLPAFESPVIIVSGPRGDQHPPPECARAILDTMTYSVCVHIWRPPSFASSLVMSSFRNLLTTRMRERFAIS